MGVSHRSKVEWLHIRKAWARMGIRTRSAHVMALKNRRCPKCGCKLNNQRTRCKLCHQTVSRPKKK